MTIEELRQQEAELIKTGTALLAKHGDGSISDPEDRKALREASTKLDEVREALAEADGDEQAMKNIRAAREAQDEREKAAREAARPAVHGSGDAGTKADPHAGLTPGESYTQSPAYRAWMERFPSGRPENQATIFSEPIVLRAFRNSLGMYDGTERLKAARALITQADASAGTLVRPDYRGLTEPGLVRPLTIRDLVTVIPTQSDAIEYVRELSRTSAAAPVADATALTGTTGLKPEGGLTFEQLSETIKTIAVWVAATKRIVADAPALRAYIDAYLVQDLGEELEDQMVSGSGAGENFRGILNTTGVINIGAVPAGESVLYTIRRAKRRIRVEGRAIANGVVLNPEDNEKVDLLEVNDETNHFAGPGPFSTLQPSIWGLPRVESEGVPVGTFLVGDFRRAILWDREGTTISVGTVNDDFIRNIVRVLAELRAGFTVMRPKAFAFGTVP